MVRGIFAALGDTAGVIAHRPGALERVQLLLEDWQLTKTRLAETESRMTTVVDELGLTALVTSITGLSAVGAAAIWPRPATLAGSRPAARWSSTPAWRHGRNCPARSPAGPGSPGKGVPGCGWRPGARSGEPSAPTPSTGPAAST